MHACGLRRGCNRATMKTTFEAVPMSFTRPRCISCVSDTDVDESQLSNPLPRYSDSSRLQSHLQAGVRSFPSAAHLVPNLLSISTSHFVLVQCCTDTDRRLAKGLRQQFLKSGTLNPYSSDQAATEDKKPYDPSLLRRAGSFVCSAFGGCLDLSPSERVTQTDISCDLPVRPASTSLHRKGSPQVAKAPASATTISSQNIEVSLPTLGHTEGKDVSACVRSAGSPTEQTGPKPGFARKCSTKSLHQSTRKHEQPVAKMVEKRSETEHCAYCGLVPCCCATIKQLSCELRERDAVGEDSGSDKEDGKKADRHRQDAFQKFLVVPHTISTSPQNA